jgi:hypothetical protein
VAGDPEPTLTRTTHSPRQTFYFGPDGLLRRHDYCVGILGRLARGARYIHEYKDVDGLKIPSWIEIKLGAWGESCVPWPSLGYVDLDDVALVRVAQVEPSTIRTASGRDRSRHGRHAGPGRAPRPRRRRPGPPVSPTILARPHQTRDAIATTTEERNDANLAGSAGRGAQAQVRGVYAGLRCILPP